MQTMQQNIKVELPRARFNDWLSDLSPRLEQTLTEFGTPNIWFTRHQEERRFVISKDETGALAGNVYKPPPNGGGWVHDRKFTREDSLRFAAAVLQELIPYPVLAAHLQAHPEFAKFLWLNLDERVDQISPSQSIAWSSEVIHDNVRL